MVTSMGMAQAFVVLTTFPDPEKARQIGTVLLEKQLIACLTILPPSESLYHWKDKVQHDTESPALLKTDSTRLCALEQEFLSLHPYETPEFIAIPAAYVEKNYTAWLHKCLLQK